MKYEIGQKVETPLGDGVIVSISEIDDEYEVVYKTYTQDFFKYSDLKPYKTPHEKLLDMGFEFEEVLDWSGNPFCHNWRKDDQRITIYLSENKITTYEVCKEAIAVLTQYLEWLEEKK